MQPPPRKVTDICLTSGFYELVSVHIMLISSLVVNINMIQLWFLGEAQCGIEKHPLRASQQTAPQASTWVGHPGRFEVSRWDFIFSVFFAFWKKIKRILSRTQDTKQQMTSVGAVCLLQDLLFVQCQQRIKRMLCDSCSQLFVVTSFGNGPSQLEERRKGGKRWNHQRWCWQS